MYYKKEKKEEVFAAYLKQKESAIICYIYMGVRGIVV